MRGVRVRVAWPGPAAAFHFGVSPDETVARIDFSIAGSGDHDRSFAALDALRVT